MKIVIPQKHVDWFKHHIPMPYVLDEGNLVDISKTITIDISIKLGITEKSFLELLAPLGKLQPTKLYSKNFTMILHDPARKC